MICFLDSGVLETKTLTAQKYKPEKNIINYQPQLGVSENSGFSPQIIQFNRVFQVVIFLWKPCRRSIFGFLDVESIPRWDRKQASMERTFLRPQWKVGLELCRKTTRNTKKDMFFFFCIVIHVYIYIGTCMYTWITSANNIQSRTISQIGICCNLYRIFVSPWLIFIKLTIAWWYPDTLKNIKVLFSKDTQNQWNQINVCESTHSKGSFKFITMTTMNQWNQVLDPIFGAQHAGSDAWTTSEPTPKLLPKLFNGPLIWVFPKIGVGPQNGWWK